MNKIILNIEPTPAPRPRVTRKGTTYYPKKYADFKNEFARQIGEFEIDIIEGPVRMELYFYMPIPKSTPKKQKPNMEETFHIKRPDADNLIKSVLDGLNGILYIDDGQVCRIETFKLYSEEPRIEIKYESVKDANRLK